MANQYLYNIDIDKLFEHRNIAEIEQIQKIIQKEIDEKKEEIRQLVGERYRDLLEAADTIIQMKGTAETLLDHTQTVSKSCQKLNEAQLFGFKTQNETNKKVEKNMGLYFSINARLKLLIQLAELMVSRMDSKDFFTAAQIHVFACHVTVSLKLETNNPFKDYFPVANKIYGMDELALKSLKELLEDCLEADDLTLERAIDSILCIHTLEEKTLDELISCFLKHRFKAYKRSLCHKDANKRVKERILSSLKVLVDTMDLVYKCFFLYVDEKSLLLRKLDEYRDNQKPTISYSYEYDKNDWMPYLQPNISKFRPTINIPTANESALKNCFEQWFSLISEIASTELTKLVNLITSIKVIQEIRKEVSHLGLDQHWQNKSQFFHIIPAVNFYKETYCPLINDRIMNIISQSWILCIQKTYEEIIDALEEPSQLTDYEYLWLENRSDAPISLNHALNQDKKDKKFLMKIKGYNEEICSICRNFDNKVNEIFSEARVLFDDGSKSNDNSLIEYIKDIVQNQINDLITKLKGFVVEKNVLTIIFTAKILTSFTELCPNLRTCLTYSNVHSTTKTWLTQSQFDDNKILTSKWSTVCNLLEEESFIMWKKFCDVLVVEFLKNNNLNDQLSYKTVLEDFVNWEKIIIEDKDEQGNLITSSICVPAQPRISIQKFLFDLTRILNDLVPQTLSLKVVRYLISKLITYFCEHYNGLVQLEFVKKNQNMALQLYFDLKFLQACFTTREDKYFNEQFQKLTNILKCFIDPFDFELFYSYLGGNVKKCIFKMQHQVGVLLPYPDSLNAVLADLKGSTNLIEKDPNVLILSSTAGNATWFPLLPVVMEEKKTEPENSENEKILTTKRSKTPEITQPVIEETKQTAQNYASNVKSGAAAFFGAMSQDWFR